MNYNIKLIEVDEQPSIQESLLHSTRLSIIDFLPPHFTPDIDTPENIARYETELEQSDAFIYNEGIIIPIPSSDIVRYLNNIKEKLESDKIYEGSNLELFKINYITVLNKFDSVMVKFNDIEKVNGYIYARFNIIK